MCSSDLPPFEEGQYPPEFCGLEVSSDDAQKMEHFFESNEIPYTKIVSTQFWKYDKYYLWDDLEKCLDRIAETLLKRNLS